MYNIIKNNFIFLSIILTLSFLIGLIFENFSKDLSQTKIYSVDIEYFVDPKLTVYFSTYDFYNSEMEELMGYFISNNIQSKILSSPGQNERSKSVVLSKEIMEEFFYQNYSPNQLAMKETDLYYNDQQIVRGKFNLKLKDPNIENNSKELMQRFNEKIRDISKEHIRLKTDLYITKEREAEKHLTRQINRLKSDFLAYNEILKKNEIEKQKSFEPAYEEKKQRIEKALNYSKSRGFKEPLLNQLNTNTEFLYLLGTNVLESMLRELNDNEDFYKSNPQFLYADIPNYSVITVLLNKLQSDIFLNEFLIFDQEVKNYILNKENIIRYEIISIKTELFDRLRNLRLQGTITIIFVIIGFLIALSYLNFKKKITLN